VSARRRLDLPAKGCDEADFEHWLERMAERVDPAMAWLGVLFALLVGYEIAVELSPGASRALQIAGWAIWAVFALEFAAKLWLAPSKRGFLRRHAFQAAGLVLPFLRVLSFLRLARVGRALPAGRVLAASYRGAGSSRRLFRSRLGYLAAVSTIATVAVAELAFLFERDAQDGIFGSFGDALIWAAGVVVALSADPRPVTTGAQLVMLGGFVFGLVVVASLAGTLGAFFLESRVRDA
jgi:voltage-gated potassium channel